MPEPRHWWVTLVNFVDRSVIETRVEGSLAAAMDTAESLAHPVLDNLYWHPNEYHPDIWEARSLDWDLTVKPLTGTED